MIETPSIHGRGARTYFIDHLTVMVKTIVILFLCNSLAPLQGTRHEAVGTRDKEKKEYQNSPLFFLVPRASFDDSDRL
jgi:hypothetical protein